MFHHLILELSFRTKKRAVLVAALFVLDRGLIGFGCDVSYTQVI